MQNIVTGESNDPRVENQQRRMDMIEPAVPALGEMLVQGAAGGIRAQDIQSQLNELPPEGQLEPEDIPPAAPPALVTPPPLFNTYSNIPTNLSPSPLNDPTGIMERAGQAQPTLPQQITSSPIHPRPNRLLTPQLGGIGTTRPTVERQLGAMNARERQLFHQQNNLATPPNSRGGLGLNSTRSVLPRINRYGVETVQPPPTRWDIFSELDQTWNVVATGVEGFVRDVLSGELIRQINERGYGAGADTTRLSANQQRFRESASAFFESFAPYENENNKSQPYLFDPQRGYWGEMGTGLRGMALYTVAMPGNLISAGLYTLTDALGFGNQDNPDYHTRGYRFAQAFSGQDLGFTNVRDGTGNRYLSAIPENRPLPEQIGWGVLGFLGDTIGLGWIDNAVSRGVQWSARRVSGQAARQISQGAEPQRVPDLLARIEQAENGQLPATVNPTQVPNPGQAPSVPSSTSPVNTTIPEGQLPTPNTGSAQVQGQTFIPPTSQRAPVGGNTQLSQNQSHQIGSLLSPNDLVVPPQPRTLLTPYELTQVGREINPATGQPYIPSTITELTGSQLGMLSYSYPNVFNPIQEVYPTLSMDDLMGIRVDPNIAETLDADIGGIVEDVRVSETLPPEPITTDVSVDPGLSERIGFPNIDQSQGLPRTGSNQIQPFVRRNPFGEAPLDLYELSDPFGRAPDNLYEPGSEPINPFGPPPGQLFEPLGTPRQMGRRSRMQRQFEQAQRDALSARRNRPAPSEQVPSQPVPDQSSLPVGQPVEVAGLRSQAVPQQNVPAVLASAQEQPPPVSPDTLQQVQSGPQQPQPQVLPTSEQPRLEARPPELQSSEAGLGDVGVNQTLVETPTRQQQIQAGLQRDQPVGDYMPTQLREEYNNRILRSGRWTENEVRDTIMFGLKLKSMGFENESVSVFESLQSARRQGDFDINRMIRDERKAFERVAQGETIPPEAIESPIHQPEVRALTQEVYPQADFTPAVDYVRMSDEVSVVGRAEAQVTAELSALVQKYRQIVDDLKGLAPGLLRGNIADDVGTETLYAAKKRTTLQPVQVRRTGSARSTSVVAYHGTKQNDIVNISPNLGGASNEFGAGLYLTSRSGDAGLYAQSGRNLTQILSPTTNLSETGRIFEVEFVPQKILVVTQEPPKGIEQVFRGALRDTFDDPFLSDQYAKDIRELPLDRWWLQARETYAKMYRTRPMSEKRFQTFQRKISRQLQEQYGYDTLFDPRRDYWVVLDPETGTLPIRARVVQDGIGTGSALEAKLAQDVIDANMRQVIDTPTTRAWAQQSRKAYYAQQLDELLQDYEGVLKQSTHSAERYQRAEWNAMDNNYDNAQRDVQNAADRVRADIEKINRTYDVGDDDICL